MSIFELVMFLLLVIFILVLFKYKLFKKQYIWGLLSVIGAVFVFHIFFENVRWQIYPLYIATVLSIVIGIVYIVKFNIFEGFKITRIVILILSGVLLLVSAVASFSFPVEDLPTPTGDFLIGTQSYVLTDENREEIYADTGNRKIKIQVWYPAETIEGYELVPWLEDGRVVAQGLAADTGLPSFILNHTEDIMSHSYSGAPISTKDSTYPVVVISHGWSGFRNLHTDLAEELASLGYIVVSIDHTYGSVATVFSDEEVVYINRDALPDRETTPTFLEYANNLVNTYAGDVVLTLDELEKMNAGEDSSMFEGRIDLENIGVLGHSTGGGGDVAAAINDERIKALIGMDAWVEPIYDFEVEKGLDIPALFLRSGSWETGENNANLYQLVDENTSSSWLYQIDGTTHYDFSMVYMYSPLTKYVGFTGDVDSDDMVTILKTTIASFFDENLKTGSTQDINTLDELWDEVERIK